MDAHLATYYADDGAHPDMRTYLYGPLARYAANGGKRHRPLIALLACEAVGGDPRLALRAAAAVEHFHTAALIHDDIEDGALTRRGEPCLHVAEGEALAINAGDLALSLVTGSVVDDPLLEPALKIRVLSELVDMTTRTIEGQALDIGWARDERFDLTVEDYLTMATHKTAHYSGATPLAIGAIIGGANDETVEALRSFGLAVGLAFQIQDDLINLVGDDTSKDFRIDITEGKRTLMAVHALTHARDARRLLEILASATSEPAILDEAVTIMEEAGSLDYARDYATELVIEAKAALDVALPDALPGSSKTSAKASKPKALLLSMADFFIERRA
ncbi:MAG: polyprenyl synthetase family protein [Coriobacteriia bacterium]|nr:polyprenyl synthetase family protein [Coriobacteriia bacterium]